MSNLWIFLNTTVNKNKSIFKTFIDDGNDDDDDDADDKEPPPNFMRTFPNIL